LKPGFVQCTWTGDLLERLCAQARQGQTAQKAPPPSGTARGSSTPAGGASKQTASAAADHGTGRRSDRQPPSWRSMPLPAATVNCLRAVAAAAAIFCQLFSPIRLYLFLPRLKAFDSGI